MLACLLACALVHTPAALHGCCRLAGKPIASLAFHVSLDVLAIGCGHKLYMWEYSAQGKLPVIGGDGCRVWCVHTQPARLLGGVCTMLSVWVAAASHLLLLVAMCFLCLADQRAACCQDRDCVAASAVEVVSS